MLSKVEGKDVPFIVPHAYPRRHRSAYLMATFFLLIVAGGYIAFRSSSIFLTPDLVLDEPQDWAFIHGQRVEIRGVTESKTRLTINGYEVYSGSDGLFRVELPIQSGFHTIEVRVKNRIGNEARVVRHIVVE